MDTGFVSRRAVKSPASNFEWARNRNAVRHEPRVSLGPVSHTITVLLLVLVVGLIYVSQGAKATGYDYTQASIDSEIAGLEAQKDSLAVENARIQAAAATEEGNKIASNMMESHTGNFVAE